MSVKYVNIDAIITQKSITTRLLDYAYSVRYDIYIRQC